MKKILRNGKPCCTRGCTGGCGRGCTGGCGRGRGRTGGCGRGRGCAQWAKLFRGLYHFPKRKAGPVNRVAVVFRVDRTNLKFKQNLFENLFKKNNEIKFAFLIFNGSK